MLALQQRYSNMTKEEAEEQLLNIQHAIKVREEKSKTNHITDFSILLDRVNDRIHMYKTIFCNKKPRFEVNYYEEIEKRKMKRKRSQQEDRQVQEEYDERSKRLHKLILQKRKEAFYDSLSTPKMKMRPNKGGRQRSDQRDANQQGSSIDSNSSKHKKLGSFKNGKNQQQQYMMHSKTSNDLLKFMPLQQQAAALPLTMKQQTETQDQLVTVALLNI